jgi:membrane glycosyltransferase
LEQAEQSEAVEIPAAIADPFVNGLHLSLLQCAAGDHACKDALAKVAKDQRSLDELLENALHEGFDCLSTKEKLYLLSNPAAMQALHRELWARPLSNLASGWRRQVTLS